MKAFTRAFTNYLYYFVTNQHYRFCSGMKTGHKVSSALTCTVEYIFHRGSAVTLLSAH